VNEGLRTVASVFLGCPKREKQASLFRQPALADGPHPPLISRKEERSSKAARSFPRRATARRLFLSLSLTMLASSFDSSRHSQGDGWVKGTRILVVVQSFWSWSSVCFFLRRLFETTVIPVLLHLGVCALCLGIKRRPQPKYEYVSEPLACPPPKDKASSISSSNIQSINQSIKERGQLHHFLKEKRLDSSTR